MDRSGWSGSRLNVVLLDSSDDGHHAEYASYLITYLLECDDDVTFATCAGSAVSDYLGDLSSSLRTVTLDSRRTGIRTQRWAKLVRAYRDLRISSQLAEQYDADVLHHLYLDGSELAWLVAPRPETRSWVSFATLFGLELTSPPHIRTNWRTSSSSFAKRRALTTALRHARLNGVFVHSTSARDSLFKALGSGLSDDALTVVPDPAPTPNVVPQHDARLRLALPTDKPTLLFFGGLRRDKGPDLLLRALALVPGSWTVVIAGEPLSVSEGEIRHLVANLPNPSQVVLRLGVVSSNDIDAYFAAADAVVLPYRRSFTATSGVLMRAAAAMKPIIATDVGDVGPIVRANHLGFVVAPESPEAFAEGLNSYLSQRERLKNAVARRATTYARENHWRVMAEAVRTRYTTQLDRLERTTPSKLGPIRG